MSEIEDWENRNLILIGGPCANELSELIINDEGYNCNDWKFDVGESLVKVFENGAGKIILIAGTTKSDTRKMSQAIVRYGESEELKSSDEIILKTPGVGECGNSVCETLETTENCPNDCFKGDFIKLIDNPQKRVILGDISGDLLVFVLKRAGLIALNGDESPEISSESEIYIYNLTSGKQTKIGYGTVPLIDGDYIVFMKSEKVLNVITEEDMFVPSIKLYQISTGEITSLITKFSNKSFSQSFGSPIISGNNVVWVENFVSWENDPIVSSHYLVLYDIDSKSTRKLVGVKMLDNSFEIFGSKIVYEGPKYCDPEPCSLDTVGGSEIGDDDIWLYDIETNKKTRITSNEEFQRVPKIYGDFIIWKDGREMSEGKGEIIYMYNLKTGVEQSLNIRLSHGISTYSIFGNKILWSDRRNGNGDLYIYDLEADVEKRLTFDVTDQGSQIYGGDYVAWVEYIRATESSELYVMKLN